MATLIEKFLRFYAGHQVDCILIGGWAATLHGSMRSTVDIDVPLYGVDCRCVTLERLIQLKRAAGRPKDLEAISELQTLLDERDSAGA